MYSYLVNDNSEHKKAKGVTRNVVATISHNEYKGVLLNKKCLNGNVQMVIENCSSSALRHFKDDDAL